MGATKKTGRKKATAGKPRAGTSRKAAGEGTARKAAGSGTAQKATGKGTARKSTGRGTARKATGKGTARKSTRKAAARKSAGGKTTAKPAGKRTAPQSPRALAEYQRKRDFSKTAEPSGSGTLPRPAAARDTPPLQFVIQKHAASHLHFDFRLELDGVMKSWAVPKGPSMQTGVRRLAMEVEDHPMSYNSFEGTIPKGQYGGGTVMLWDRGHYLPADGDPASLRKGLRKGRLDIVMLGERLKGGFTLVRSSRGEGKPQWLLFKRSDEYADPRADPVEKEVTSVVSGRTMDEIAEGDEVWHSNRA